MSGKMANNKTVLALGIVAAACLLAVMHLAVFDPATGGNIGLEVETSPRVFSDREVLAKKINSCTRIEKISASSGPIS